MMSKTKQPSKTCSRQYVTPFWSCIFQRIESDEARKPMVVDEKEDVGVACDTVGGCVQSRDMAVKYW